MAPPTECLTDWVLSCTNIPVLKSNRWENLLLFNHPDINSFKVDLAYVKKIEEGINYLKDDNLVLNSKQLINKFYTDSLYNSCNGKNLKFCSDLPFVHSWLRDGMQTGRHMLAGRDSIAVLQLRTRLLPTPERKARIS